MSIRILQNPYDSQANDVKRAKRAMHLHSKVTKIYSHKPFFERWRVFNMLCGIGGWLCQLISPLSALAVLFFFIYDQTAPLMAEHVALALSLALSLAICLGVEGLKRFSTQNALIEIFNYKRASLALALALVCSAASVTTSFVGAYTIPSRFDTPPSLQSPQLEDLTKIDQTFADKIDQKSRAIQAKRAELANYESNNQSSSAKRMSKRAKVRQGHEALARQLHTLESELATLNTKHLAKLDEAKQQNALAMTNAREALTQSKFDFEESVHKNGLFLGWFCLVFESLFWCFLLFNMWYYKTSEIEFSEFPNLIARHANEAPKNDQQSDLEAAHLQPDNQRAKVGFYTEKQQLANRCKISTDSEGKVCLKIEGKAYSLERLRNNYHANISKARKYTKAGKVAQAEKYTTNSQKWLTYIDILMSE